MTRVNNVSDHSKKRDQRRFFYLLLRRGSVDFRA